MILEFEFEDLKSSIIYMGIVFVYIYI